MVSGAERKMRAIVCGMREIVKLTTNSWNLGIRYADVWHTKASISAEYCTIQTDNEGYSSYKTSAPREKTLLYKPST